MKIHRDGRGKAPGGENLALDNKQDKSMKKKNPGSRRRAYALKITRRGLRTAKLLPVCKFTLYATDPEGIKGGRPRHRSKWSRGSYGPLKADATTRKGWGGEMVVPAQATDRKRERRSKEGRRSAVQRMQRERLLSPGDLCR